MLDAAHLSAGLLPALNAHAAGVRVGIDITSVPAIAESLERFGERFLRRLFTADEIEYATEASDLAPERLAARFAAKEAAIKAFDLGNRGVDWREIEVRKLPGGACCLQLHGKAAALAYRGDTDEIALSLSHDGDYAAAVVTALLEHPLQASQEFS